MADYWTTPKINWVTNDGIGYADLNRIEANISALSDATFRKVQGCGYSIDNTVVGEDGVITIAPGSCYSSDGVPMKLTANFVKNLTTWAQGNGAGFGGMASGVTAAAYTWYYIFLIMNPDDGTTEIMIDDNIAGTHISNVTYTIKRFINSLKTRAAGADGSFDLVEMYSTGDKTFINPNSMYVTRNIAFSNNPAIDNRYKLKVLTKVTEGLALPAKEVLAHLNIYTDNAKEYGLISNFGFTVVDATTALVTGGIEYAEVFAAVPTEDPHTSDTELMIDASGQLFLAMAATTPTGSFANIAVIGYTDERLNQ